MLCVMPSTTFLTNPSLSWLAANELHNSTIQYSNRTPSTAGMSFRNTRQYLNHVYAVILLNYKTSKHHHTNLWEYFYRMYKYYCIDFSKSTPQIRGILKVMKLLFITLVCDNQQIVPVLDFRRSTVSYTLSGTCL